ncbi:hypothetical protein [Agrobacterium tumefaciens]|uniref:hypothetical protein n=1 Tax=Agrobacterium tumefaciens TaxID=358 RepID=UPI0015720E76|nr:hypothetical protein [Agrobacterium tumefaciens]NSY52051.1 hypothetical protein [Agrobacterium tumefaciens]NTC81664.1 hypothetical protein [Agrobacterium tumefaciens]NTD11245.1 hypothetical protein [Agrobacterium tumefaciens]WCK16714.1 hypothetical protein G6L41_022990 [Agrobacterium tumefaciens]
MPKIAPKNLKVSATTCRNGRILTVKCQTTEMTIRGIDPDTVPLPRSTQYTKNPDTADWSRGKTGKKASTAARAKLFRKGRA